MVELAPGTHVSRIEHEDTTAYSTRTVNSRPLDRVRWPAIIAGLFGTLSVLAVLGVLGVAVGLSAVDRNSDAGNFGLGAGIWGGVSALLAFAFGGWLAARTAAIRGEKNGMLQGAMVWMVTIGLLIYLVAGGVGAMFRTATDAAAAAASNPQVTSETTRTNDPNSAASETQRSMQNAAQNVQNKMTGENVERAAERSSTGAWGTLAAMLLGLAAASGGGYLGARKTHDDDVVVTRTGTTAGAL